jgi:hypothetical protein
MSEVRLVVREAECDWSGTIPGSIADRAVAALSADPVTLGELETAMARFEKPISGRRFLGSLSAVLCDEPYDAGLVVIDLMARIVVADSTYSFPRREGTIEYHNGHCCSDIVLRYHLADDWQFINDGGQWRNVADARRRERAAKPLLDARAVFYGRPMFEFIARGVFSAFSKRDEIAAAVRVQRIEQARQRQAMKPRHSPDEEDAAPLTAEEITAQTWPGQEEYDGLFYDTLKQIHADWLLTPRDDLGGKSPREIAFDRRDHLTWDLQDRCEDWSALGVCPPGLAESSHAYRYGAFGTHELVKYYDLVRELLWSCWGQLSQMAQSSDSAQRLEFLTVGDFLALEVPRLEAVYEEWLDKPDLECHGRTARSIIARERARLPEGMSSHDAMIDPDCPCCQMMADMPGPVFWNLDGSSMDDDFAFDLYRATREEWDEEQRRWKEHSRKFDAERSERERLGVTGAAFGEVAPETIWSRSFAVGDTPDVPLGIRIFGLGCRLAELIVELRCDGARETASAEDQAFIDRLNRDFGNLREILQSPDSSLTEALIAPVHQRFAETLDTVMTARPDLAPLCESLKTDLEKLVDPPTAERVWDSDDDSDLPF